MTANVVYQTFINYNHMTIYDKSYTVEIKQTYLLSLHKKFMVKQHINKLSVEISSSGLIDMFALIHTTYNVQRAPSCASNSIL